MDKQIEYVRKVGNIAKMGLETKVKQLESTLKAKTEELESKDKEI